MVAALTRPGGCSGFRFYGFAIGMTGAMTVGSVSGGAFNPAVSTGLQPVQCIVAGRCQALSYIWMYLIAALFANPKDHFYISKKQEQR